ADADGRFGTAQLVLNSFGSAAAAGGWASDTQYTRLVADLNGDGRADIVGFGAAGTYVSLNTGSGFGAVFLAVDSYGTSSAAGGWTNNDRFPRLLADTNGDGLADIIGFGNAGVYVSPALYDF
ncbi:MAG: VCBS repeat-containing protein, partial [Hyphomicrobiales bacterium]